MSSATLERISLFLAEMLGTAILVFMGCSACIFSTSALVICITFGLAVMLIVNVFGCISGAHLNPAVTIAAVLYKLIPAAVAPIYMAGQFVGAFVGFGVLKSLVPGHIFRPEGATGPGVCSTVPNAEVSPFAALSMEFIITAVLILICCAVWDPRNAKHHDSVPLRFGLAITGLALAGGPLSGGSMNPARSLGPAVWNGDYQHHWIYWVGPILASLIVTPFYKLVFAARKEEETPAKASGEDFPLSTNNV
ncbi:aquaporin-like [Phlebotomus argentipes]|uniref:aquaporin-like n=1 Tax=Phlebotomus argentipes TaxID=94469 RepID=UPI00289344A8|nr:aquaporin-like [Phlebotomus argentipes]